MSKVQLQKAIKKYENLQVIHGVDLTVDEGEFCVFVGPSGCGKSTLLRMIAGLEETTDGTIMIGDNDVTTMDAADREVAMVFQTYALYPHMTVEENMGFGLKMTGVPKDTIKQKVTEVSRILNLEDYMNRKPKALSGGQRQRVAIGRALVRKPKVFLFDEPLSNLDAELRIDMRIEIARLHKEVGATMIYVTHDQVEAMTLADKIVVLRDGIIEQIGRPLDLYGDPANKFVAGFIGSPSMNFVSCAVQSNKVTPKTLVGHTITAPKTDKSTITVGIRPEHLQIDPKGKGLKVEIVEQLGGINYVHAKSAHGDKLAIEVRDNDIPPLNTEIGVKFSKKDVFFFDTETEQRIR